MAKLPLDKYLEWGSSSTRSLTIDQTTKIMLDFRHTRDWAKALKHVPTRKLKASRDHMLKLKVMKQALRLKKREETQASDFPASDFKIPTDFTFASRKPS